MSKEKVVSILVLIVVVGAIVGFAVYGKGKTSGETAKVDATVAVVNGVEIKQSAFDTQLASAISSLSAQGTDTTSTSSVAVIRGQVMDSLIANELVAEGVAKAGIKASDADVETQFQALVTQSGGAEKFAEQLKTANLTEAQLRANIANQLAIQAYLLQNIDAKSVVVTDAEIKKFYDDNSKGQTGVPPLKDVSAQIKQQLTLNKQQVLVNEFIAKLRAGATVEIKAN